MVQEFADAFPKRLGVIANRVVGHFLPIAIAENCPRIKLTRNSSEIDLKKLLGDAILERVDEDVSIKTSNGQSAKIRITHLILEKSHRFSSRETNWVFFVGNGRVADRRCIDGQIGLKLLGPERDRFYVAYVTGKLLDKSVNTERTGFSIQGETLDELQDTVRDRAKEFLNPDIKSVRDKQTKIVRQIIQRDPVLREFADNVSGFVKRRLRLSAQKEEDIYIELYRHHFRNNSELRREEDAVSKKTSAQERIPVDRVTQLAKGLSRQTENALAAYIRHRYRLLELLDKRLGLQSSADKEGYVLEKEVHEIIAPLRGDSQSLSIEENNIWLLDDRLPFYKYFASDIALGALRKEIKSASRPDLIFFDKHLGFTTGSTFDPVILVEFKRPGRDDYNAARNNPVNQLIDYLRAIREKSVNLVDLKGRQQSALGEGSWVHGFIVADLTKSLTDLLENYTSVNARTHDGLGYTGMYPKHKLIVQAISYKLLVAQAAARNRVLFEKLGLNPLQF